MKIKGRDEESGKKYESEANEVNEEFVERMSESNMTDEEIKRIIDKLNISADAKLLLYKISKGTIQAGRYIIKIGRKIIDFICQIFTDYPSASFGMVFGAIAGVLIASIPIIGVALGSIVTPLLMMFGLAKGLQEEIKDKALARRIAEANAQFRPLKT